MASVEYTARATLNAWLSSLALSPAPTVVGTEEPEAGPVETLPTVEAIFPSVSWNTSYRREVSNDGGRAVWDYGSCEAELAILWRCGSEADAEAFRDQFRAFYLLAASDTGETDEPVLHLPATFYGVEDEVVLRLRPSDLLTLASPASTGRINLYVLQHGGTVEYPLFVQEPAASPTGLMDVIVERSADGTGPGFEAFNLDDYRPTHGASSYGVVAHDGSRIVGHDGSPLTY